MADERGAADRDGGGGTWPLAGAAPAEPPTLIAAGSGLAGDVEAETLARGSRVAGAPEARGRLDAAETLPAGASGALAATSLTFGPIDPTRYERGREIARGGMGRIVAAHDRRLGRDVAIKELLDDRGDARARFEREARITARLQHPGIVSLIEAGVWPNGEPFYVMKLVAGRSLDHAIAARATLTERLGLVAHIAAAVDALAYAHSLRVLHRDLKPGNVLVGAFGETVVIDWGLAKDLADLSSAPDVRVGPYRTTPGNAAETAAGEILGTPAYMPPEQALGELVDERADVYALGAMLYHVLAGAPPYLGANGQAVLQAVVTGPPPPLAERAPGVPAELVAITAKAMAQRAEDRYPTAGELAQDLKKFQTGQLVSAHTYTAWQLARRWLRRHRGAVAVAGVAVGLLIAVGAVSVQRVVREQARTEVERARAEENRGDAEALTSFMLGDLQTKLQPLGKLDLLADVAHKAVAYYDRRGDALSDAELGRLALARRYLGDVLRQQKDGDLDGALREYRASLAIAERRAAAAPGEPERQRDVAESHEKIGDALALHGDDPGALAEYRTASGLRAALAASAPARADWQAELGAAHDHLGAALLAHGDVPGALVEYRAALAIAQALATAEPSAPARLRALGKAHNSLGNVLLKQRDPAAALVEYRAALAIAEQRAAADPTDADAQRALSVGHNKLGNVLHAQGDDAGALREYRQDLAISTALAALDPTSADRQSDLSVTHNKVGNTLLALKDPAGALAEYRASIAITEAIAARDPGNADRQRAVAIGHNKAGDAQVQLGDPAGARADYLTARALIDALAARDPVNAELQVDRAESRQRVGDIERARGDRAAAAAEYEAGLAIAQGLLARAPQNADAQEIMTTLTAALAAAAEPGAPPRSGVRSPR